MFFVWKNIRQEKYWVSVSVSDFKGVGLGSGGLSLEWQVSVSVLVSDDEVSVLVSGVRQGKYKVQE